MLEMLRVIREQEPSKPSTKLSTAKGLPTLAANRGTEPAKLAKLVRGELDWIVMKALEKDRNRRYETANGFAMDVQRYLADEPIKARPTNSIERLVRWSRRHPGVTASLAVIGLLVSTGLMGLAIAVASFREQARAQTQLAKDKEAERGKALQAKDDAESARRKLALTLTDTHTSQGLVAGEQATLPRPCSGSRARPAWPTTTPNASARTALAPPPGPGKRLPRCTVSEWRGKLAITQPFPSTPAAVTCWGWNTGTHTQPMGATASAFGTLKPNNGCRCPRRPALPFGPNGVRMEMVGTGKRQGKRHSDRFSRWH